MRGLFILSTIILSGMLFGCQDDQKQIDQKHDAVMKIHDAVMPKLSEMNKLGRLLKENMTTVDSTEQSTIQKAILELENANKAMFDWMGDYNKPSGEMELKQALDYLENQEKSIIEVEKSMLTSISNAETILQQ